MKVSSVSPERCEITRGVAVAARQVDRVERLADRANLVDLDQNRIGDALVDALLAGSSMLVTKMSSPTS